MCTCTDKIWYDEKIMCGRFTITNEREMIERRFGATFDNDFFKPRYNAAPSQSLPVILNTDPQTIKPLIWGLRPQWFKRLATRDGLINVRAESLREKPTFKHDLRTQRCVVLADGFYEWKKTDGRRKTPYRIQLKTGELFAFAGIWEENEDMDGEQIQTFAIITTAANELVGQVHNRMPVILPKEQEQVWLETELLTEKLLPLLNPYPANQMKMYEITVRVNRASEDGPEIIEPVKG
jgi:putative SOS response-associated peptidase YedK